MSAAASPLPAVGELWWLVLVDALVAAVIGILLLVWPDRTLALAAGLVGGFLLLIGVLQLARAAMRSDLDGGQRGTAAFMALVAIAAGAFLLLRPEDTVRAVAIAVGLFLVISGIVAGIGATRASAGRGLLAVTAIVEIGVGAAIIAWPDVTVTVYATLAGIYLLVRAVLKGALAFSLRSAIAT